MGRNERIRGGYKRQCLPFQRFLVRMNRGTRMSRRSMSKMSMMVEAKRESRMTIATSTSSIRLSTALRKPAVVRVETILAVDLVE